MSTVTKSRAKAVPTSGAPYGNTTSLLFSMITNAAGVMQDSDQATAVAIADKVRLGVIPAGFEIHDSLAIVSDAFTALTTAKVGFEYVDGVDSTDVPQDDDYFTASLTTHTAGRYVANNTAVRPVRLPKDAYLTLVVAGAAHASVGVLDVIVRGENKGAL
jgi:hypothetical protein